MLPTQQRFPTFSLSERPTERTGVLSFSMCARHFIVNHSAGKTWSDLTGTLIFCVTLMDAQLTLNITSISGNKDRVTQNVTLYNTRIGWVMWRSSLNLEWIVNGAGTREGVIYYVMNGWMAGWPYSESDGVIYSRPERMHSGFVWLRA